MIGIEIRIDARPRKRAELLQALESLAPTLSSNPECASHEMYEDVDRQNRFLWVERWEDRAALEARMRSDPFKALLGAVHVLSDGSVLEVVEVPDEPPNPRTGRVL